nr:MAG TPA: hypothetical protein [Caudoviricetes sp.]
MMDAIEFVKQLRRMDEKGVLKKRFIYRCAGRETDSPEDVVAEVEQWSAAHPRKTRQSVFLEQYPEASISEQGVLLVCPCPISASHRNVLGGCATIGRGCDDCRKEYWLQEVE